MSRPSAVFVAWSTLLVLLAVVLWLGFRPGGTLSFALPAFAAGAALLCGALALAEARREPRRGRLAEELPGSGLSVPSALFGIGIGLAVLGLAVGTWLSFMAAIPMAFGLYGLVREGRGP